MSMAERIFHRDQDALAMSYESGTYGADPSGAAQWVGLVQEHNLDENVNVLDVRYLGQGDFNVGQFVDGKLDFTGTLRYNPQDFRMLKFALGRVADAGSPSPYTHTYTSPTSTTSPPEFSDMVLPSFSLQDAKVFVAGSNLIRNVRGCVVDNFRLKAVQGERLECEIDYLAQNVVFASGAALAPTEDTARPFLWSDTRLDLPSGTQLANCKEINFELRNNLRGEHYVDANRTIGTPVMTMQDFQLDVVYEATAEQAKPFYDQYFLGGSTFNAYLTSIPSTGSRVLALTLSGCKLVDMSVPSVVDGDNVYNLTIRPQAVSAIESSLGQYYNAGSYQ